MKVALIGGTGFVGSALLDELLRRRHEVVALARDPAKYTPRPGLSVVRADVQDAQQVRQAVAGCDAVLSGFNAGWGNPDIYKDFMQGSRAIQAGIKAAGVKRYIVVGGAGSLYAAPGVQIVDTPGFPAAILDGARAARDLLKELQELEQQLDWTLLSPPIGFVPGGRGERTGKYRVGKDEPLMDGDQPGTISAADLAVAVVDELERPAHVRQRFTIAY
ncbi:NAD(P)-dependent oxidoreductase [Comamonas antarctica]|uniref:NAD(P)-dependent oxidoreductase n=1 Tax=Comamonas antarctica TaxID=2743470 RepID=A0A6N1X1W0_9BURK|nr:NAD(P)-dependent oxidoreductase [Comamonas antarctica]QKV52353.1 NAD(P)-dependent oxidoreductase [Comamonas antarctica]